MLSDIEKYRFNLRLYLNGLGGLTSLVFFILQYIQGEYAGSFLSLMGVVYFVAVIHLLVTQKVYLWKGRGFALFIPTTILNTISHHPDYGVFWPYVGIISIFLLLELKEAAVVTGLFILVAFYLIAPYFPSSVLIRIYATFLLVFVFTFLFSYLIEHLLIRVNSLITHDPLTNALNRHTFHTSIENALNSFARYKIPATLFIFDLDFFKNINDTYGHQKGDFILKSLSKLVTERLRDCDQLFRYGGEEFAVLFTQTKQDEALKVAEDLRKLIEGQDYELDQPVTISGGVSQVQNPDQINTWIERCDKALYKAKANGRNNVVIN